MSATKTRMARFARCRKDRSCKPSNYCDPGTLTCQPCSFVCNGKNRGMCDTLCPGIQYQEAGPFPTPTSSAWPTTPLHTSQVAYFEDITKSPVLLGLVFAFIAVFAILVVAILVFATKCLRRKPNNSNGRTSTPNAEKGLPLIRDKTLSDDNTEVVYIPQSITTEPNNPVLNSDRMAGLSSGINGGLSSGINGGLSRDRNGGVTINNTIHFNSLKAITEEDCENSIPSSNNKIPADSET